MALPDKLTYGSYEVLQNPDGSPCLLGQGSFGATYKARHVLLGRVNALKVIREDVLNRGSKENQEETNRFLSEARAVGKLHHPGIAMVHDCALDNGVFYYAMEYCDGGTLHDWCEKNGPLPWSEVRVLALQIAEALDYAHASGFLHRDIKPSNIMLNGSGKARQAKIIDFGLAQKFTPETGGESSSATVHNDQENFRGNLATASPEQILEQPLDQRSDLFSFGVTLWWLLIGKNPFAELKSGPMIADRVGPSSYATSLPPDLAPDARELLEKLLEKDAAKRPATAHAVVEQLGASSPPPAIAALASPAAPLEPLPGPPEVEDLYAIGGTLATASQAKLYLAENLTTKRAVIAIIPDPALDPDARGGMRVAASRKLNFGAYAFHDWCASGSDDVFVISKPEGCSLLAILRKFGPARFADALPLLSYLARCFDASHAWTTFGIQVDPGEILLATSAGSADLSHFRSWSDLDPQTVRCLPFFTTGADPGSSSEATLSSSAQAFPPLAQFAALVYRVLAGSAVRYAAFFTTSGYVMASGLSEDGNALLAATINSPETQPSACRFIQLLASRESLTVAEMTPLVAPPSPAEIATGKLVPTPASVAPSNGVARAKLLGGTQPAGSATVKVAEIERQLAMAKRAAEEDTRQTTAAQQRQQAKAAQQDETQRLPAQAIPPAQTVSNKSTGAPATPPSSPSALLPARAVAGWPTKRLLLASAAAIVVLVITITVLIIKHNGNTRVAAAARARQVEADEHLTDELSRPVAAAQPAAEPTPAATATPLVARPPVKPSTMIKVPGDVSSIGEAVKLCQDGGTIEISGGPYSEALMLTRSVSLVATSAAVLEDRGSGSTFITVSGPIQVTLRNIQIKNTQENTQSNPALVLIKDRASMHFEGGGVEGSAGDGVALQDKASASFANCQIRKNRSYGINVSSGSKVEISLSSIQENGKSGIAVMNVGSTVKLGNGTKVEENNNHGVEVANGATLQCSGVTITNNLQVGLNVAGSGSSARLDANCVIASNRKQGIGVSNSGRVDMTESTVEDNSECGLYAKSGAQVEIQACHFKSNGPIGCALMDSTTKLSIIKTDFTSHSDMAIAFEQGCGTISNCTFINNTTAIYYGEGATGAATGNAIKPGPLEKTLIKEGGGTVTLENNTINTAP